MKLREFLCAKFASSSSFIPEPCNPDPVYYSLGDNQLDK